MKYLIYLFMLWVVLSIVSMSSCGDNDQEPNQNAPPEVWITTWTNVIGNDNDYKITLFTLDSTGFLITEKLIFEVFGNKTNPGHYYNGEFESYKNEVTSKQQTNAYFHYNFNPLEEIQKYTDYRKFEIFILGNFDSLKVFEHVGIYRDQNGIIIQSRDLDHVEDFNLVFNSEYTERIFKPQK